VGRKLNEAVEILSNEANHHTKLALAKQTEFENGFAQGFTEALRIARNIQQREN
jgi:flagellar biosynthesis/type III secretory pathway protein FliH